MKFCAKPSVKLYAGFLAVLLISCGPVLSDDAVETEVAEAVTEGQVNRYSLTASEGDILRVDRQNGTVSVCRKQNDAWRCNPVPIAEEAYLAEINELAIEVDRLTARVKELEAGRNGDAVPVPPGSALDRPKPKQKADKPSSGLTTEDEEELDKVLNFTEGAMRRFFGMVRELQKDLEGTEN
ncbi:MAG: hypothetical protein ABJJ37_09745 [Roseibium sp.]